MALFGILVLWAVFRMLFAFAMERAANPLKIHENSILRLIRPDKQAKKDWKSARRALITDVFFIYAAIRSGLVNIEGELAVWQCVVAFLGQFLIMEFVAYWMHRAEHKFRILYRMHATHHSSVITTPATALLFSLPDRLSALSFFVMPMALFSLLFGAFPLWLVFAAFALHDSLNSLAHFNREFTSGSFGYSKFRRYVFSPTHHAMHHVKQRGNYAIQIPLFDHMFGTYLSETDAVAERARNGQGLTSLRRGSSGDENQT